MNRRNFLSMLPPLAASPFVLPPVISAQDRVPMKITDIRVHRLKVIKETGMFEYAWTPGRARMLRAGGGSFTEVYTDQGITGIGTGMDSSRVDRMKELLVGRNPFDIEDLGEMRYYGGSSSPCLELAMWDIIGKATQQPLYKIWGAVKDRIPAYCSLMQLSTPEERADMATRMKEEGWKAIKIRIHNIEMKEDIRLAESVRKAVGDDLPIMTDANQAQSSVSWQPGIQWDFKRALDTARVLDDLNYYWLEEPRPRYDYEGLAELNRLVNIPLAGGENNRGVHEFRWMLDKGTYDILQPEFYIDGIQDVRTIASLALAANKMVVPHHGGFQLGVIAHLHLIGTWSHCPYIEICHDPPIGAYTNGFAVMENPPLVRDGYIDIPQGPGLGVEINRDLIEKS